MAGPNFAPVVYMSNVCHTNKMYIIHTFEVCDGCKKQHCPNGRPCPLYWSHRHKEGRENKNLVLLFHMIELGSHHLLKLRSMS